METFIVCVTMVIYLFVLLAMITETRNADAEIRRLDKYIKEREKNAEILSLRLRECEKKNK